jgi:hypothetical protein
MPNYFFVLHGKRRLFPPFLLTVFVGNFRELPGLAGR